VGEQLNDVNAAEAVKIKAALAVEPLAMAVSVTVWLPEAANTLAVKLTLD
jgi:hypothetical protein